MIHRLPFFRFLFLELRDHHGVFRNPLWTILQHYPTTMIRLSLQSPCHVPPLAPTFLFLFLGHLSVVKQKIRWSVFNDTILYGKVIYCIVSWFSDAKLVSRLAHGHTFFLSPKMIFNFI
jgi:hypothetical protein